MREDSGMQDVYYTEVCADSVSVPLAYIICLVNIDILSPALRLLFVVAPLPSETARV